MYIFDSALEIMFTVAITVVDRSLLCILKLPSQKNYSYVTL